MKEEIITEATIKQLIDTFYAKVRNDAFLAPVFEDAIGRTNEDWQPHLEIMYAFWSSVMLTSGRYKGNPMKKHLDLPKFDIGLFDRWLALFAEAAHEIYAPEIAFQYIERSAQIARTMKHILYPVQLSATGNH